MSRPACKLSSINTPRKLRIQRFYINLRCRIKFLTTQHCLVEEKWNGRRSFKKHFQISHTPSFFAQQALHQKLKNLSDGTNTKNQVQHLRVFCKTDSNFLKYIFFITYICNFQIMTKYVTEIKIKAETKITVKIQGVSLFERNLRSTNSNCNVSRFFRLH